MQGFRGDAGARRTALWGLKVVQGHAGGTGRLPYPLGTTVKYEVSGSAEALARRDIRHDRFERHQVQLRSSGVAADPVASCRRCGAGRERLEFPALPGPRVNWGEGCDAPGGCAGVGDMAEDCGVTLDPVCGCDVTSYTSAACANERGVRVAYEGECND